MTLLDGQIQQPNNQPPIDGGGSMADGGASPTTLTIPDDFPKDFVKDGAIDFTSLKSIVETSKASAETQAARAADIPEDGVYNIELPKELVDAENNPIAIDNEDPALLGFLEFAKEAKLTKSEVNAVVSKVVSAQFEAAKAQDASIREATQAELAKLGDKPQERLDTLNKALAAQIGEENATSIFSGLQGSASAVIALEALLDKVSSTNPNPTPLGGQVEVLPREKVFFGNKK